MAIAADSSIADVPEDELDTSSDEDFVDDVAQSDSSASEEDAAEPVQAAITSKRKPVTKKRKLGNDLEPDSGDEAVKEEFRKAKKRQRKGRNKGDDEGFIFSDDEGGEGGLIKTRRQRLEERVELKRRIQGVEGATADVNAIWARLSARLVGQASGSVLAEDEEEAEADKENGAHQSAQDDEYITIKRTYDFAGEVKTEERRVLKSSAEAKLYLQSKSADGTKGENADGTEQHVADAKSTVGRPLKRAFRFDPNPQGEVRGLPEKLQLRYPRATNEDGDPLANVSQARSFRRPEPGTAAKKSKPADKINTVDKSRMDWAGFVDQEGLAEELDEYGKAKSNFVDRRNFLARAEARRDEGMRDARLKQQQAQQVH